MKLEWAPGEKEAYNNELKRRPLYLCDPDKNAECPKTYCAYLLPGFGECRHTLDIRSSKLDGDGKPVRVMSVDEYYAQSERQP